MTLTTHAITGAALATLVPNYPALGFVIGFGSHYLLDAIPHWAYSIASLKKDETNSLNTKVVISKDSYWDLLKIGADGVLGLALASLFLGMFYHNSLLIIFLGAIGSMLPDALQFCYWKWKWEPLTTLQRLHNWAHTKMRLDDKPVLGVLSQVLFIILVVLVLK